MTSPPYTIGYFGRIAPEKGLHLLADAYVVSESVRACRKHGSSPAAIA